MVGKTETLITQGRQSQAQQEGRAKKKKPEGREMILPSSKKNLSFKGKLGRQGNAGSREHHGEPEKDALGRDRYHRAKELRQ